MSMYAERFHSVFPSRPPILGMVHLHALPGSPTFGGSLQDVITKALADAQTLADAGVDALLVENLHDYPYYPETIEPETVASATVCAKAVAEEIDLPMGINILRNSWKASLGIAAAVGAKFIRLNILTDAMITDQGMINGAAHLVSRYRKQIGADDVLILADLLTKHAAPLVERPVPVIAADMIKRGGADGIIIAGHDSSQPASQDRIREIKDAIPDAPVIMGSGMTVEHAPTYAKVADGAVFGWGSKPNADMLQPVSSDMATEFANAWTTGLQAR
ncbi:BtpA/SgcQ family protein [Janibacter cremeus]|uniref:BtpA/SgcQ family protein n=1 Tax=Janibacter cremeus TaxID=1285192 RepID=A0A852VK10_9MICO|nr:BtpA/SgcQ family protein [Janibacter cremeus]NYF97447.1 hypothetical protein [Janibacter cremeus]